jgi:SAM-dependent methyltransferase
MAAVEDAMWFYRALHTHLERELIRAFNVRRLKCGRGALIPRLVGGAGFTPAMADIKPALQRGEVTPPTVTTVHNFRILDAGCGTGGLIRRLAPRHANWTWTGIDFEPLACALARERTQAEIVEGSITALPFDAERFDAVVCSDVLYHLDDDEAALREIFRVLVPGGSTVINVPAHRWLWSYHDVTVHGRRRYVRAGLREKLRKAGFADIRLTHWNSLPLPLVFVRRKFFPPPASGSDVRLYPAPIEAAFRGAMALERGWLACFGALPVGSSILAVARKPTEFEMGND